MKKIALLVVCFAWCLPAFAQILWMGGEDIDFPNGQGVNVVTTASTFRAGYAREAIDSAAVCVSGLAGYNSPIVSTVFPSGAVTSAWLHVQRYDPVLASNVYFGLGTAGTTNGLWIGSSSSSSTKAALWAANGSTQTELASESGTSLSNGSALQQFDLHVSNYGATATVVLYLNGSSTALFSFTGNVTVGGATSFNSVFIGGHFGSCTGGISEIIVSANDTRSMSLATLAPSGAGTVNTWTSGTYLNIGPTTINNASVINSQTASQDFAATMNSLPSGSFSVAAVKITALGIKGSSGITSLSTGVYTHSTVSVPAAVGENLYWFPIESYYAQNPVTSAAWTLSDINALQIYLQSAP